MEKTRPSTTLKVASNAHRGATVYGRRWLVFALDEAHKIRTQNASFNATAGLRSLSEFLIAVTATPITTSPKVCLLTTSRVHPTNRVQDIFNIGRCIGIPGLMSEQGDEDFIAYNKKLGAAGRLDKKARLKRFKLEEGGDDDDDDGSDDDERIKPSTTPNIRDFTATHTEETIKFIITDLREKFTTHVVRRTGASTDNTGKPLAGIAPAREHILSLTLFDHEYTYLDSMTEEFRNEDGSLVKMSSAVSISCSASFPVFPPICVCAPRGSRCCPCGAVLSCSSATRAPRPTHHSRCLA